MRLLFDTNAVLWRFGGQRTFGPLATAALTEADEVAVSVVAFIEIGIKVRVCKLTVPDDLEARVRDDGARVLGVTPAHGLAVAALPLHHRDPFDRLLVAQARQEALTIVTSDRAFAAYDVRTLDPLS